MGHRYSYVLISPEVISTIESHETTIFPVGFPMVFSTISVIPTLALTISYGFPMVFLWFSNGFDITISVVSHPS